MTQFSKVLVVSLTTLCLAFMGFAMANSVGGPNWQSEARDLDEYAFTTAEGTAGVTWTVTTKLNDEQVASNLTSLPAAVNAAIKHRLQEQSAELDALNSDIELLQAQLAEAKSFNDADRAAMTKREDEIAQALDKKSKDIDQLALDGRDKSDEANKIRQEAELRREDVMRVRTQLDAIRSDTFHLEEQQVRLNDLVIRTEGVVQRLQRRKKQLTPKASPPAYDEKTPEASPPANEDKS